MTLETRARVRRVFTMTLVALSVVTMNAQLLPPHRTKPFGAYYFEVEINGITYPFKSCSGLKIETEVIEYREGGATGPAHKLPGNTKYSNIRLTRAFTGDRFLYDWFTNNNKPNPQRVTGRIKMFDPNGVRLASWKFFNGFPAKWEGPDLDASANEAAIETIEIAHEGLVLTDDEN